LNIKQSNNENLFPVQPSAFMENTERIYWCNFFIFSGRTARFRFGIIFMNIILARRYHVLRSFRFMNSSSYFITLLGDVKVQNLTRVCHCYIVDMLHCGSYSINIIIPVYGRVYRHIPH
jgi:hypothetical protein